MKILYLSHILSIHDSRFLEKLSSSNHDVLLVAVDNSNKEDLLYYTDEDARLSIAKGEITQKSAETYRFWLLDALYKNTVNSEYVGNDKLFSTFARKLCIKFESIMNYYLLKKTEAQALRKSESDVYCYLTFADELISKILEGYEQLGISVVERRFFEDKSNCFTTYVVTLGYKDIYVIVKFMITGENKGMSAFAESECALIGDKEYADYFDDLIKEIITKHIANWHWPLRLQ